MNDIKAEKIISYYKKEFNIKNKNKIIEDLHNQVQYVCEFSNRRENYINRLEMKNNKERNRRV
tara:strand:+ start:612 stop:800 length:189 start_codon:yes stop_codon:yes gene_type:complete